MRLKVITSRRASVAVVALAFAACSEQAPQSDQITGPSDAQLSLSSGGPNPLNANPPVSTASHSGGAVISNGVVQLGVNQEGHLNSPYWPDPLGIGYMGLRYVPTGAASTEPGCQCEGWGVADVITGARGGANVSVGGVGGLVLESFTHDASTATSVVVAGGKFRVTHEYKPSPATANLYEVKVTLENISGAVVRPRYRRVMDWDVYPTPFAEYVTIHRGTAADIYRTDNNGFNSWDPFDFYSYGLQDVNFSDAGPNDHGALFDFQFADIPAGEKRTFKTYYGATATEAEALVALGTVGAEAYSLGQPSTSGGPSLGTPNTFIFAFGGIGGAPIIPPSNLPPLANAGADQVRECVSHSGTNVTLNGSGSTDSDGTIVSYEWKTSAGTVIGTSASATVSLAAGSHVITLTVTDDDGATSTDQVTVNVVDTTAPTLTVTASPGNLWPPNHKYHVISVGSSATDACDHALAVAGFIVSNEADEADGTGDGETTGDIRVTKPNGTVLMSSNASPAVPFAPGDKVEVRAERYGTAAPRVYSITLTATDDSGNATTRTTAVTVAHDQGK